MAGFSMLAATVSMIRVTDGTDFTVGAAVGTCGPDAGGEKMGAFDGAKVGAKDVSAKTGWRVG
jgi:hypothetical protein